MIITYIITPKVLHSMGVKNIYRELLRKRIKAIRRYLLQADLVRIQENLFEARFHK